jgi:hypothetical protein
MPLSLPGREGHIKFNEPEDLPKSLTIIQSFRVKGMECIAVRLYISTFFINRKQSPN